MSEQKRCTIRVVIRNDNRDDSNNERIIEVDRGVNLRHILLREGLSPYAHLTRRLNCGGRGLCATCGVWIEQGEPIPTHWHDKIGNRFGYPRLSCQITVDHDMTVRLIPEKRIWGKRKPKRQSNSNLKSG